MQVVQPAGVLPYATTRGSRRGDHRRHPVASAQPRCAGSSPRAPGSWRPDARPSAAPNWCGNWATAFDSSLRTSPPGADRHPDRRDGGLARPARRPVQQRGRDSGAGVAARARTRGAARRDRHAVHQRRARHAQGGARHARAWWRDPQLQQHCGAPRRSSQSAVYSALKAPSATSRAARRPSWPRAGYASTRSRRGDRDAHLPQGARRAGRAASPKRWTCCDRCSPAHFQPVAPASLTTSRLRRPSCERRGQLRHRPRTGSSTADSPRDCRLHSDASRSDIVGHLKSKLAT